MNDKYVGIPTPPDLKNTHLSDLKAKAFASGTYDIPNLSSPKNLRDDDSSKKEENKIDAEIDLIVSDASFQGYFKWLFKEYFKLQNQNSKLQNEIVGFLKIQKRYKILKIVNYFISTILVIIFVYIAFVSFMLNN